VFQVRFRLFTAFFWLKRACRNRMVYRDVAQTLFSGLLQAFSTGVFVSGLRMLRSGGFPRVDQAANSLCALPLLTAKLHAFAQANY
jgi:hypothetical protein